MLVMPGKLSNSLIFIKSSFFSLQNFRSHMNSVSHQQRMMEIQHMSNACLVTLLPRVQESLQGASKDGCALEKERVVQDEG